MKIMPKPEGFITSLLQVQTEHLIELEQKKQRLQNRMEMILEDFQTMPENLYKILYYRHVDGLRWEEIALKTNYSRAQCHRLYDNALKFDK